MRDQVQVFCSKGLQLPPAATDWLCNLWDAIQFLDDVVDGDAIDRKTKDAQVFNLLVGLPMSPFFRANADSLYTAVTTMIMKWHAANDAEESGKADARSFVARAGFYDVVLMVVTLCHGPEIARDLAKHVMWMYGETLEDYLREFNHA